jgi:hypothetical protein
MFSNRTSPLRPRQTRSHLAASLAVTSALLMTTTAGGGAQAQPAVTTAKAGAVSSPTSLSADALVKLVARRKLWPLKPEWVEDRLHALGPWKREQPIPEALTLLTGRMGVVERSELSYSGNAKKQWIFLGATFFLGGPDLENLHQTLSNLIQVQLGKPSWTRKGKKSAQEVPAVGWKLGNRLELLLTKRPVEGERLLAIMIPEPQGGPGD